MSIVNQLQRSADRMMNYKVAMSSFELYGESCALCGGYAMAAMDETVKDDPGFLNLRQSMVDLFGETRVSNLEMLDENQPMSAVVNTQAISYADSVVKSRVAVESSREYQVLSQIMADASHVSMQRSLADVGAVDKDVVRQQTETLFRTYAAVSCDGVAGLESVKNLARDEMIRYFGNDTVSQIEMVAEASDAGDQEAFDNIVKNAVDRYVDGVTESAEDVNQTSAEAQTAENTAVYESNQEDAVREPAVPRSVAVNVESGMASDTAKSDAEPEY